MKPRGRGGRPTKERARAADPGASAAEPAPAVAPAVAPAATPAQGAAAASARARAPGPPSLWRGRITPLRVVAAAALVYTLVLGSLSVAGHLGLRTQLNDLGNADQALWAASQGDWSMTQSNTNAGPPRSRISVHANLIFWPLSLIYRVWPSPLALLLLTTLACAATGLGIYALSRRRLGDTWWAAIAPLAFWASPITHDANLYDFPITTVATAFLVWALWAFDARRTRTAAALVVAALVCKEDVPLTMIALGAYFALSGRRRAGLAVAAGSVAYLALLHLVVIPAFNGGAGLDQSDVAGRYRWLGASTSDIVSTLLFHPGRVLARVLRPDRLRLPLYVLVSGAAAAWRSWRLLLLLLPTLAICMLASGPPGTAWMTRVTGTYYLVGCEAVIVLACVLAAEPALAAGRRPRPLLYLAGATAALSLLLSPLPHGLYAGWDNHATLTPAESSALADLRRLIPDGASVCAQNNLGPQLSHRRLITIAPGRCQGADFAAFWLRIAGGPDSGLFVRSLAQGLMGEAPRTLALQVSRMLDAPDTGLVFQREGFYLFQRHAASTVPRDEAQRRLDIDAVTLARQLRETVAHRSRLSRWLVLAVSWDDLL